MSYQIERSDNYALITIEADKLDTSIAPSLKSELVLLNSDGIKNIIIDLSATRYCDSSGLSAILVGNRLCKNCEGTFIITGLQAPVKKLISISQLDTILTITDTLPEATSILVA